MKNLKLKIIIFVFMLSTINCGLSTVLYAQPQLPYELIEVPTAYPIQKGDYALDFRVYGSGGVLAKIRLGLLDSFFLGLSLGVNNLVGSGITSIDPENPGVLARFRIFDEITSKAWPTISLGFDSSNYGGDKGRGFYGVASKEFPIGKMFSHVHGGLNKPMGGNIGMCFFIGYDIFFSPEFLAIAEIASGYKDPGYVSNPNSPYIAYNFGVEYTPIATLKVGFSIRNLFVIGGTITTTREIHIGYTNKLF